MLVGVLLLVAEPTPEVVVVPTHAQRNANGSVSRSSFVAFVEESMTH
jgi:hypothetical protein